MIHFYATVILESEFNLPTIYLNFYEFRFVVFYYNLYLCIIDISQNNILYQQKSLFSKPDILR